MFKNQRIYLSISIMLYYSKTNITQKTSTKKQSTRRKQTRRGVIQTHPTTGRASRVNQGDISSEDASYLRDRVADVTDMQWSENTTIVAGREMNTLQVCSRITTLNTTTFQPQKNTTQN